MALLLGNLRVNGIVTILRGMDRSEEDTQPDPHG